jgi:hypothetical protein
MLGPCLAAVGDWILQPPFNISSSSVDPFAALGLGSEPQSATGRRSSWNEDLLTFFGFGSAAASLSHDHDHENVKAENLSPASLCTGIFLHIFLDFSQVITCSECCAVNVILCDLFQLGRSGI